MTHFFEILGKQLSKVDGLRSAYLPRKLGRDVALQIAKAANNSRLASDEEPYAVVVDVSNRLSAGLSPLVININQTVQYRLGNRLFIFLDSSKGLASIEKSMHVLMSESYPDAAKAPIDLQNLAKEIILDLLQKNAIDSTNHVMSDFTTLLQGALETLVELHKKVSSASATDWNLDWFLHVSRGVENLYAALATQKLLNPSTSIHEFFKSYTFAAFGLPNPKDGHFLKGKNSGISSDYEVALGSFWKEESLVYMTLEHLKQKHKLDADHPIAGLNWNHFDRSVASNDSALIAFLELASDSADNLTLFTQFTEDDFFNPLPANIGGELSVTSAHDSNSLRVPIVGQSNKAHFLRFAEHYSGSDESVTFVSEELLIRVPTLQPISPSDLQASSVRLQIQESKKLGFEGVAEIQEGTLYFRGKFTRAHGKGPIDFAGKHVTLGVSLEGHDSLVGKIDERASTKLFTLPDLPTGLLIAEVKQNNKFSGFAYIGPLSFDEEFNFHRHEVKSAGKSHLILAWGDSMQIEGVPQVEAQGCTGIFATKWIANSTIDIEISGVPYRIETPTVELFIESPIHAAAKKAMLTRGDTSVENKNSLFGKLDASFSQVLANNEVQPNNLHMILPVNGEFDFESISGCDLSGPIISTKSTLKEWKASSTFSIDESFRTSQSIEKFNKSFLALEISRALCARSNQEGKTPDWISRTSWEHLWSSKKAELDEYFQAFEEMLIEARKTNDPETIFWASYPLSASIWDTTDTGKCVAVILSPLHPLRLGWVASTEWALRNSELGENLAGAIEGWNLPSLGPAPTSNGSTIAIPSDSGRGQVFLGWSLMTVASISGFEAPKVPMRIAGVDAPGGGASGLNKSSTTSALNDYRRINPHVTTMTIDLAASTPSPRLREIDDSILKSISLWAEKERLQIPGGVRVWDSLNRGGTAPIAEAAKVASDLMGIPLTWTRYKHENGETKRCNVRFLQDSGIKVEVRNGMANSGERNKGAIGVLPIRRFETHNGKCSKFGESESFPGLGVVQETNRYARALQEFEQSLVLAPSVRSRIFRALLIDENAEWAVSGESLVSPSGISSLLDGEKVSQMLWEWRPPLFDTQEDFALEKRPFISVARIPISFKTQVADLLTKAEGKVADVKRVDEVLSNLGGRGVGLSSLLSMGGTHASGALGFHLSLSLLDQVKVENSDTFIMPIDACDSFLRVLSGDQLPIELTKRADLLSISMTDSRIILTPIEIKFYGLGVGSDIQPPLPRPHDKALKEAITQAQETKRMLEIIASNFREVSEGPNQATKALWLNALASLVEAAIKLEPNRISDPERLSNNFNSLVLGASSLSVGKPLVAYYLHNGVAADGGAGYFQKVQDDNGSWGLLSLNTSFAFQQASLPQVNPAWQSLWEWCLTPENVAVVIEPEPGPEVVVVEPEPEPEPEVVVVVVEPEPEVESQVVVVEPTWHNYYPVEDGVRVIVGNSSNTLGVSAVDFWPGNTELTQMNIGVVGDLGTGKTQFLKSLVTQIRHSGERVQDTPVNLLVFDYKLDYQDADFLEKVNGRVLSPDNGIPLNVLALSGEYSKSRAYKRAMAFCDVLGKIYSSVGPVQKNQLTETIVGLFESYPENRAPTLSQVASAYKAAIGKADSVISILNKFVLPGVFVEDPSRLEKFKDLIADRVVVVALNEFGADAETKNALVVLMLDLYYEYMLTSKKWPFIGSRPQIRKLNSFLLVDEATNIMQYDFPVLKSLLLEGREWGFGTILASQYLSHFKTSNNNYGEPLKTWVIHKVPSVKQNELLQLGLTKADEITVSTIAQLKVHQALYESLGHGAIKIDGLPFYKL